MSDPSPLSPEIRAMLEQVSTATLSMQLLKRGIRNVFMRGVKPLRPGGRRLVGPAYTLRFIPMREDLCRPEVLARPDFAPRRAIEEAPPGSILVVDGNGRSDTGTLGDILAARLSYRGVAGFVSDGAVRDAAAVAAVGLPVWCAGAAAPANIHGLSGADLQVPIGCGGVAVIPGDLLVCDDDGVVVVPQALAAEVAEGAREQERLESFIQRKVAKGSPIRGVYPPNEETLAAYQAWIAAGEPPE